MTAMPTSARPSSKPGASYDAVVHLLAAAVVVVCGLGLVWRSVRFLTTEWSPTRPDSVWTWTAVEYGLVLCMALACATSLYTSWSPARRQRKS